MGFHAMSRQASEYARWRSIDYRPTLREIPVDNLAPYLHSGQRALEIGCNRGRTALWLGRHGLNVLGIDINGDAIVEARTSAHISNVKAHFIEGDFLDQTHLGKFDLLVMVRVLTCFSELGDWRTLLIRALECVAGDGLIYIHHFIASPENDAYRERYREAAQRGWRTGNFAVPGTEGGTLFIAHHHSVEELNEIMNPYEKVFLNIHDSLSLNGNTCRMFEFLGKRYASA
jgi:SAM-dependent methyltransferase